MDNLAPEKRSKIMASIKFKDTLPEIKLRSLLHKNGYRFRLQSKVLPFKPDIILPKYKTVIFAHGCFWHQHKNCIHNHIPTTNQEYWLNKLSKNIKRDKIQVKSLKKLGWKSIVVWECEIISGEEDKILNRIKNHLNKQNYKN